MFKRLMLMSMLFVVFLSSRASATWFDSNYKYKQQITIQNGQVDGDLTDFPVLITQADLDTEFFNHVEKSTVSNMDIIFTNAAENSKLSREIVHFNSGSQEFEAWVKTNLANATDTVIFMYYGYSGANEPNQTDTWSNNFAGVWHMQEDPDGTADDINESTQYGNHGSSQNMAADVPVAGKIGSALDFDGTSKYINCGDDASLRITSNLTVSAWINVDNAGVAAYMRILSKKPAWDAAQGYGFEVNPSLGSATVLGSGADIARTASVTHATQWRYVVGVINGTTGAVYWQGSDVTDDATVSALATGTQPLTIAKLSGTTDYFDGQIDEVRVSSTNRPAAWISTEYNNQNDPASFYNVSAEYEYPDTYRSVGPGAITPLVNGTGSNLLTISGYTATISGSGNNIVGVGDVIQYDSNGDSNIDSLVVIHGRTNNRTYTVKDAGNNMPTPVTNAWTWSIFRAYTSLANVDSGTENSGLDGAVANFDGGGNRDLVANQERWLIACYRNGTTADGPVNWDGWTTDADHYIRIFTPYDTSQVGISQRHNGTWDTSNYYIQASNDDGLQLSDQNIRVEGIQIYVDSTNGNDQRAIDITGSVGTAMDIRVSHCILRGYYSTGNSRHHGVGVRSLGGGDGGNVYVWNNIIYDFGTDTQSAGIYINDGSSTMYAYNNTVSDSYIGCYNISGTYVAKNNVIQNATTCYSGTFAAASTNNISEDATAPGTSPRINSTVSFANEAGDDFHLNDNDTQAKYYGADLSADASLSFSDDIDLATRTSGDGWSCGADENDTPPGTATATPTTTPTPTFTHTPTDSPTITETPTFTHSPTLTMTPTASPTGSITETSTMTPTRTQSATITMTPTITQTLTPSPPWTHTNTPTVTPTPTYTATPSVTPTFTETPTRTITRTITVSPTITQTLTITQTATITQTSTHTPRYVAPDDLANVIIYPNPYRSDEKPEREITFNNVPRRATIRLYNVAGRLVTTLEKDSSLPWIQWDLKNNNGTPVASGIYIYIIKANGQERRGKIAILQ